jgi:hypothetical protein
MDVLQAIASEVLRLQLESDIEPTPVIDELGGVTDTMLKV